MSLKTNTQKAELDSSQAGCNPFGKSQRGRIVREKSKLTAGAYNLKAQPQLSETKVR